MSVPGYNEIITKATRILFSPNSTWENLAISLQAIHQVCSRITGIQGAIKKRSEGYETPLPTGLALSPGHAADCMLDTRRTVKYIRALDAAVKSLKTRFPDETLHILYAGTGPFAPFAIALSQRYPHSDIQFTALDIHEASVTALRQVIRELHIADWFRDIVQCDATEYRHSAASPIHIVVTETMHRTVSREPHVAITLNLAPQLTPGGVLIPEQVTVSAAMSETLRELEFIGGDIGQTDINHMRTQMGSVFELTKDTHPDFSEDGQSLECATCVVPAISEEQRELVLSTRITLWGDIAIEENESGITAPWFYRNIGPIHTGDILNFRFSLNCPPELTCSKQVNEAEIFSRLDRITVSG